MFASCLACSWVVASNVATRPEKVENVASAPMIRPIRKVAVERMMACTLLRFGSETREEG